MILLFVEGSDGLYSLYNGVKYIPKEDSCIEKGLVRVLTKEEKDGCVIVTGKNIKNSVPDLSNMYKGYLGFKDFTLSTVYGIPLFSINNRHHAVIDGVLSQVYTGNLSSLEKGSTSLYYKQFKKYFKKPENEELLFERVVNYLSSSIGDYSITLVDDMVYVVKGTFCSNTYVGFVTDVTGDILVIYNEEFLDFLLNSGKCMNIKEKVTDFIIKYHIRIGYGSIHQNEDGICYKDMKYGDGLVISLPLICGDKFSLDSYEVLNKKYDIQGLFDKYAKILKKSEPVLSFKTVRYCDMYGLTIRDFQFGFTRT